MNESTVMDSQNEARLYGLKFYSPLIKVSGHLPRFKLSKIQLEMAHWCVVEHCEEATDYLRRHTEKFDRECPNRTKTQRVKHFLKYFRDWMEIIRKEASPSYSKEVHRLARYPQSYTCYSQCYVNDVKFVVLDRDWNKRTQNSGDMVEDGDLTYYGIIQNIIELRYANGMHVVIYYCTWFNTDPKERGSTKIDYGLLSIDTSSTWFEDWLYCLATTTRQVFYLDDLKAGKPWKVVNIILHRGTYSDSSLARDDQFEDDPYQEQMPTNISSDVKPYDYFVEEQIPRVRRQLYLGEEDDMFQTDDESVVDEDDKMMFHEEDDQSEDDDDRMDQTGDGDEMDHSDDQST
ncbi:unnamed protein product [Rhodiola kirilowii]